MDDYMNDLGRLRRIDEAECRRLIKLAQAGDIAARNAVVEANLRLVISFAKGYSKWAPMEELIAEGNLGLFRAVDKFDLSRRDETTGKYLKFSTYATQWVRQFISSMIRLPPYSGVVRVPAHLATKRKKITRGEIKPTDELHKLLEAADVASRFGTVNGGNGRSQALEGNTLETVIDHRGGGASASDGIERAEQLQELNRLLKLLQPREKRVLLLLYPLKRRKGMTLAEAGKVIGVTKERVRQIKEATLRKLRREVDAKDREQAAVRA